MQKSQIAKEVQQTKANWDRQINQPIVVVAFRAFVKRGGKTITGKKLWTITRKIIGNIFRKGGIF